MDLIARGNTDIPSFSQSYQEGLKSYREARTTEQQQELRGLQIEEFKVGAPSRAKVRKAADVKAEYEAENYERDKQIENQAAQVGIEKQTFELEQARTQAERGTIKFNQAEQERHVIAAYDAMKSGNVRDAQSYIANNLEDIKAVSPDATDEMLDSIIRATPDEASRLMNLIYGAQKKIQSHKLNMEKAIAEKKKGLKANEYVLPNGQIVTENAIRQAYKLEYDILDEMDLKILQATNPERYLIEKAKSEEAPTLSQYALDRYEVDLTGKAPRRTTATDQFNKMPIAKEHKGKRLFDSETNEVLISDGNDWLTETEWKNKYGAIQFPSR